MAVTSLWVGGVTTSSVTVVADLSSGTNARLMVSTASTLAGATGGTSVAISSGFAKVTKTGLTAGTQYYYGIEVDGVLDTTKTGSFRTAPDGAASFSFVFGSCALTGDSLASFTRAKARNPDLCIINGDLHYEDPATASDIHFGLDTQLAGTFGSMAKDVPVVYTWSDHDFGANNSTASSPSNAAANSVYRQRVPSYPLVATPTGIYHTFVYGRVRFIVVDERSFKSDNSDVDDSSKTVLGATQKQWLKDTITAATEPLIFWVGDSPWNGSGSSNDDEWFAYDTERQELAAFFLASGKDIIRLSGDMHAVAADDGSTSSPGNIPVLQAAPWGNTFSNKAGPYTSGPYPTSGTSIVRQYGHVTVTDDGSSITVDFAGYDSSNVKRVGFNRTYAADAPPPAMPVGDLPPDSLSATGWTQFLAEDFNTNCAEGSFIATYPGWFGYPDTWSNSPGTSWYNGGNSIRVESGVAKVRYFTDGLGRARTEALEPPNTGNQSYGVYEVCYRVPSEIPGYKQAFLLWPESDVWGDGEVDYPEANFTSASFVGGFVHERGSTPQNNAYSFESTTPVVGNQWHVARIVWGENQLDFYLNGVLIGSYTSTQHVPVGPHRWVLQTECGDTLPSSSVTGDMEIAYVAAWTMGASAPVYSDWSDPVSATTDGPGGLRSGSAAGSVTWAGSATGTRTRAGSAAGSVSWSGSATGSAKEGGAATGTVSWAGVATGVALSALIQDGAVLGSVARSGVTTGIATRIGAVTTTVIWAGGATGVRTPGSTFFFSPPSHEEPIRTNIAPLRYYRLTYAKSLLKLDGTWTQIRTPAPELLEGLTEGVDFFRGGYEYEIPQPVAAELQAAGFTVTPL